MDYAALMPLDPPINFNTACTLLINKGKMIDDSPRKDLPEIFVNYESSGYVASVQEMKSCDITSDPYFSN